MPCTGTDLTDRMKEYCQTRAKALVLQGLAGYIFKSRSPSCGTREVKVYSRRGGFRRVGRGFFAAEIMGRFPLLPVITEEELHDPLRRLGWITRVFAMAPLGDLWRRRWMRDALAAFHESYALTLRAHSPAAERRLRALSAKAASRRELRAAYEAGFHKTLAQPTSRGKQARILRAVLSRLRPALAAPAHRAIESMIGLYQTGQIPLVEVVSVLRHYAAETRDDFLTGSDYLFPDPREWRLRAETGL